MSGTNTPEYKTFFRNQAKIADAISDVNGLNDRIVAELYSMKIVGKAVRDAADIRGPQVTEIQRVRPVMNALVTRIKVDKTMYYKVRDVLLSDTISVDAPELALYLPEVPLAEDEGGSHGGTGAGSQPAMAGGYTQPSPYQTQPTQPGYAPQSYQHPSQVPVGPSYAHQPLYSQPGLPPQQGVLTAQDLHILTSIMKAAAPQWQAIGGALGFLHSDLTIIQNTPMLIPQAPQSYFREMLSQWLNWAPPNHSWPTLEALEMALRRSGQENLAFQLRSLFLQQKGYVPQYSQNPSQFPAGPTHQPVYFHPGYPPTGSQYPPQQGYYYGQPAPSTQLPPVGAEVPPHQYTGAAMQGPSYQGANQGYSGPGNIIRRGDKPVLPKLLKFPGRRGKINIPEQIGTNYKTFGIFLLQDDSGTIVSGIERAMMHDADEINEAILQKWIGGKGQGPFTWDTLVKCLRDTELNVLADEIEEVLQW